MYEGVVYFAGPMTLWAREIAEKEIVFKVSSRWRWLTLLLTLSAYGPLDHARCGYIIKRGDQIIARETADDELSDVTA
jgi:hypothetical protein